jgi:hypothetical protein
MNPSSPIWLRQENETDASFKAFAIFRDMGTSRTHDAAFALYQQATGKIPSGRAPRAWFQWADAFDWKVRIRAYDDALEAERLEIEARRRRERIEQAHDDIEADAQLVASVNRKALKKVKSALERLEADSEAMRTVTGLLRAGTYGMQVSTTARLESLGISELLDGREALKREEEEEGEE